MLAQLWSAACSSPCRYDGISTSSTPSARPRGPCGRRLPSSFLPLPFVLRTRISSRCTFLHPLLRSLSSAFLSSPLLRMRHCSTSKSFSPWHKYANHLLLL